MPRTGVVFYKDDDGAAPAYDGLRDLLRHGKKKEFAKCRAIHHKSKFETDPDKHTFRISE